MSREERINNNLFRPSEQQFCRLLEDLIRIPSYPGISRQETELATYIRDFFSGIGIEAELFPVVDGRCNVMARLQGSGGGKNLILNGHLDTVPPYDLKDALKMRKVGRELYGRGTADMKGALACMMLAMSRLKASGTRLAGDVVFIGVIDEEMTSAGTCALLKGGLAADGAVVGEPMDGNIGIGHKGLQWFEFRIHGKAVHGGEQENGINAIRQAMRLINRLEEVLIPSLSRRVHPVIGASSLNYGYIQGGFQPSTVAGECLLQIDRRWIPGEKYETVVSEFSDLIAELEREDPEFTCDFSVMENSMMSDGLIHEGFEIDINDPLVVAAAEASFFITGKHPDKAPFKAWTDAGLISTYGKIPTIVFGPGMLKSAHTRDEMINIDQALDFVGIYTSLCIRFCGLEKL
ncbi:MAG: M20 family metallopeptidase [Spirochaetales bacterium]|nr:M20 family metallopeptidase [Spirochaetales bacterium]